MSHQIFFCAEKTPSGRGDDICSVIYIIPFVTFVEKFFFFMAYIITYYVNASQYGKPNTLLLHMEINCAIISSKIY